MMGALEKRFSALDEAMLGQLREVWGLLDPPPGDLDARVRFVIDLADLDVEVAHLQSETLLGSAARASDQTRTVAFNCPRVSLIVVVTEVDGGVRLDGWHAPAGMLRVELRTAPSGREGCRGSYHVETDESGRFVFPAVPHGLAQLVLHGAAHAGRSIVTPSIRL